MNAPARPRARSGAPGRLRSATHLRDRLDAVVDCTLWCLGCDVRHPDGNLLVEAGFTRVAPPADRRASTMYHRADRQTGSIVAVWGFALLYADAETAACHDGATDVGVPGPALSLRRNAGVGPRLTSDALRAACWTPDTYAPDCTPATPDARQTARRLLRGLADAITVHERWIATRVGPAYRRACEADRPRHVRRRQRLPTLWLPDAWNALAESYAQLLATEPGLGPCAGAPPAPSAGDRTPVVPPSRPFGASTLGLASGSS